LILAISAIPANGSLMLQNDTKLSVKKNKIAINLWYNGRSGPSKALDAAAVLTLARFLGAKIAAPFWGPPMRPNSRINARSLFASFAASLAALFVSAWAKADEPASASRDLDAKRFHQQVEPILREHCYPCHSHAAGQMENGLALDWKSGWVKGGDRGPAIVPGKPDESLLVRAIRHVDPDLKMPEEQLDPTEIETLVEWVRQGAFDDREITPLAKDAQPWWSLKPLASPPIPGAIRPLESGTAETGTAETDNARVDAVTPATHPIDAFVSDKLAKAGLDFSPPAEARELIRRVHFDLVGLPPTPEEVEAFVAAPSERAYVELVDRLLQSPRYGERWARHWFDTIHFADSHGYEHDVGRDQAWPYRDYVIEAFNADIPWADFVREQLAVDHFKPDATDRIPALGFLGAGTFDYSTYSTGPVTFDYLDRDDLLTQTMAAFVSTTANCARCHAHKFDPITQEDYYALQAVFAGIVKGEIGYDVDRELGNERERLESLLAAARRGDASMLQDAAAREMVERWTASRGGVADWKRVDLLTFLSTDGATLTADEGGMILAGGTSPEADNYVLNVQTKLPRVTALRLDLFPHDSLPMKGPGRCQNGNLHLSEVAVSVFNPGDKSARPVAIAKASADFDQEGWGVTRAIDGDPKTAWGIHPAVGQPHHAVFEFAQPLELVQGATLTVTLRQLHGGSHLIGAFALSVSDAPSSQTAALPHQVEESLATESGVRTDAQRIAIASHVVRLSAEEGLARLPQKRMVYAAAPSVAIPMGGGKTQPASIPTPKVVHLLQRGDISKPKDEVPPGALSCLSHLPARFDELPKESESARRAALADWIAHPENVLTWRSIVNRVWHYHFGRGLCDTPSDFGRMGGAPSHPELIDWLAVWFRDEAAGSLKRLHRLIVTSRTYRQSSRSRDDAANADSENRLLWRQNRLRVDADAYRDAVLSVSGRIDWTMGGPAIQHFATSPGAQLTPKLDYNVYDWNKPGSGRRSIYRFVWRGIPDPLMAALDFPDLGLLTPNRSVSVSPLQALALFNNRFVLFHSDAMATDISLKTPEPDRQVIEVIRRCYQRDPVDDEPRQFGVYIERHGLAAFCRLVLNSSEFLFVP
jgi:hypothetical protein